MSHAGIKGMQAAGDDLLGVAEKLTDEQWHAIADMFTFDLTTHLHYDVLAGSTRATEPRPRPPRSPPRPKTFWLGQISGCRGPS
jgi:hypothetical protein